MFRTPRWIVRALARRNARTLFYVDTAECAIALTIDDAPHPDITPGILRTLRSHNARATFFVIGAHAREHPQLVEAIRADGHELANHLYTDRLSWRLSSEEFVDELRRTDRLIQPDGPIKWCRPGSGAINQRMVNLMLAEGYRPCLASDYPLDAHLPAAIARRQFRANVAPGAILVLHDGAPGRRKTIRILEETLPEILRRGYRVLTVSQLAALASR